MKILFIEDDKNISTLAKEIFMKTSHDIILSPGVFSGIQALSMENFNLIILDMVLLDGTGEVILKHLYENKINTPVFIHSGYSKNFSEILNYYKKIGIIHRIYEKPSLFSKNVIKQINSLV